MALGKRSEQTVSVAPAKCPRIAHVEPSWAPCFATNALPDHDMALGKRSEQPVSVAPANLNKLFVCLSGHKKNT